MTGLVDLKVREEYSSILKKIILSSIIIILFSISSINTLATTIIIDNSDPTFESIQQAINEAQVGDTLFIKNGTYSESIYINKTIRIQGESKGNTLLSSPNKETIIINAENVTIFNVTLTNSKTALQVQSSNCTIFNSTFLDNNQSIMITNQSQHSMIYHNNFIDNQINAVDHSNSTIWYKNSQGNHWDDYNGSDTDNDGIGDSAYILSINSSDNFPVINPITIHPVADFYSAPSSPDTQTSISFTDLSTDKDGSIISWSWDFGDENTSFFQNPLHQYADDGTYQVTLKVTDDLGATDTQTITLTVRNVPPEPSFTFEPETPLDIQQVEFNDTSSDADGYIVNHTWIINDTIIDYTSLLNYTFPDDGVFSVTLKVIDDDGSVSSSTRLITVLNVAPTAGFSYSTETGNLSKNQPINFKDASNDVDGSVLSHSWDFGDGTSSTEKHPSHAFSEDKDYTVKLTVTDDDGATDSYTKQIQIGERKNSDDFLTALNLFDIINVIIILAAVIAVIIISKKFT
jgi:PKD repeat protein